MPNGNSSKLTAADWRLLEGINEGISNKELAAIFCKSEFTVRNRLSLLYAKINVSNRNQAALWYRKQHAHQTFAPAGARPPELAQPL